MARRYQWSAHARSQQKLYRVLTLRKEGFTEPEIRIFMDRRMSTRGMLKIRRERAQELRGYTDEEKQEWRAQNEEAYDEQHAADALTRVSPDA